MLSPPLTTTDDIMEGFRIARTFIWPAGVIVFIALLFRGNIAKFIDEMVDLRLLGGRARRESKPQGQPSDDKQPPLVDGEPPNSSEPPPPPPNSTTISHSTDAMLVTNTEIEKAVAEAVRANNEQWANVVNWYAYNLHYERTYRLIFGTQINLLRYLTTRPNGARAEDLAQFYTDHLRLVADPNYSFPLDGYLGWLQAGSQVIERSADGNYLLTAVGRGFLNWLDAQRLLPKMF